MKAAASESICVRVQMLGGEESVAVISPTATIAEVRTLIARSFERSAETIRIVFQGKLLSDSVRLCDAKITDGAVLHFHVRPNAPPTEQFAIDRRPLSSDRSALARIAEAIGDSPFDRGLLPKLARLQQRTYGFRRSEPESLEAIRQCLLSAEQIFHGTDWQFGQWIDARDGDGQWIEARIVELDEREVRVQTERGDATIPKCEQRVSFLRSRTVPSPYETFLCPTPTTSLGQTPPVHSQYTAIDALRKVQRLVGEAAEAIRVLGETRVEQRAEEAKDDLITHFNGSAAEKARPNAAARSPTPKEIKLQREGRSEILSLRLGDQHSADLRSINSLCFERGERARPLSRSISPKEPLSESSSINFSQEEREPSGKKLSARGPRPPTSRIAPFLDRLGRAMIDLAPHIAMLAAPALPPGSTADFSTRTLDESFSLSGGNPRAAGEPEPEPPSHPRARRCPRHVPRVSLASESPLYFQLPVLLTPGEVLHAQLRQQEVGGGYVELNANANVSESEKAVFDGENEFSFCLR